ncbi:uncharacterized protein DS421_8g228340 [Arachis hypogaea]|nr:uncharacterized protein DS421_8g228340 [Arachis hypogaea]
MGGKEELNHLQRRRERGLRRGSKDIKEEKVQKRTVIACLQINLMLLPLECLSSLLLMKINLALKVESRIKLFHNIPRLRYLVVVLATSLIRPPASGCLALPCGVPKSLVAISKAVLAKQ